MTPDHGAGTLILAPHADDAALSLGGSISAELLPRPITVLTVFGRSSWTAKQRALGAPDEVTAVRRAEEQCYTERRGLQLIWLGYEDALLRGGMAHVFLPNGAPTPELVYADAIVAAAAAVPAQLLLAPLAIGDHRDHVILRALAAAAAGGRPLAYYEDLPYAGKWMAPSGRAVAHRIAAELRLVELPMREAGLKAKLADLEIYRSQIDGWQRRAVRRHGASGAERVWADALAFPLLARLSRSRR